MNHKLPKPMLDALAREATPAAHPSPDVLAAFVEHTLSGGENQRITEHLARCADCREVVFLASGAAEQPVAVEQDRLAAAGVPLISPALPAMAHPHRAMASASAAKAPRRRWTPRIVWAVPVAAVVLIGAGLVVQQRFISSRPGPQLASKVASNAPGMPVEESQHTAAAQTLAETAGTKPALSRKTKTETAKSVPPRSLDTLAMGSRPPSVAEEESATPKPSTPKPIHEVPAIVIGGTVPSAAPVAPRVNSFAASQAERPAAEGDATAHLYATPQVSVRGVSVVHPQWRVTAEGHLEHFVEGSWTRVLANQTTTFRVVSVIGNDVWVGGNGGTLFHSRDGGQQWRKVSLVTSSGTETGTIVSIQFDDSQRGVVITENGARCSTSDGGMAWTKE